MLEEEMWKKENGAKVERFKQNGWWGREKQWVCRWKRTNLE